MKLSQIQEARYHRSPVIDIVNKATEKLLTKEYDEEYGTEIPDANREQIIRDMDSVYDRASAPFAPHDAEDDEDVWTIKHLDDHPNGVKLEATLYTDTQGRTFMVVYKF